MRRGAPGPSWRERIFHALGMMRMRAIERVCRSPLIMTDDGGTARAVLRTWKQGASVLGLVDLPPPLVDRTASVEFFGRQAQFPPTLVELALRQSVPIYVYIGEWDAITLRPRLYIRRIDCSDRSRVFQAIIAELEAAIRRRPGAWHAWGDSPLYFAAKA
jgi:lauroyl/myristoyl acyltransferase